MVMVDTVVRVNAPSPAAMRLNAIELLRHHGVDTSAGYWDAERERGLKILWAEGYSASQCAKALTNTSRNAIIGKVHRMGLALRASAARPVKRSVVVRPRRVAQSLIAPPRHKMPVALPELTEPQLEARDLAPLVMEDGAVVTISTIRDGLCRFPIGDPMDADFAFCGRASGAATYCKDHARLTYTASETTRSRRKTRSNDHHTELRQLERIMKPTYRGYDW